MMEILKRIKECDTMPKLDNLRLECLKAMQSNGNESFYKVQKAFIKQKNKLRRIPLDERKW